MRRCHYIIAWMDMKIRVFYTHILCLASKIYIVYCIIFIFKLFASQKASSWRVSSSKAMTIWKRSLTHNFTIFFFFWRVRKAYFHRQVDSLLTKRVGRTQTIHTKCWSIECGECWESERIITTRTVKATSDDDEQCEKKNIQKN